MQNNDERSYYKVKYETIYGSHHEEIVNAWSADDVDEFYKRWTHSIEPVTADSLRTAHPDGWDSIMVPATKEAHKAADEAERAKELETYEYWEEVYRRQMSDDNLSWCKPLASEDGRVVIALNEGEICGLLLDGVDTGYTDDDIKKAAMLLVGLAGQDYEWCKGDGWTDEELILEKMYEERSCGECPWFSECDAMRDDVNDLIEAYARGCVDEDGDVIEFPIAYF